MKLKTVAAAVAGAASGYYLVGDQLSLLEVVQSNPAAGFGAATAVGVGGGALAAWKKKPILAALLGGIGVGVGIAGFQRGAYAAPPPAPAQIPPPPQGRPVPGIGSALPVAQMPAGGGLSSALGGKALPPGSVLPEMYRGAPPQMSVAQMGAALRAGDPQENNLSVEGAGSEIPDIDPGVVRYLKNGLFGAGSAARLGIPGRTIVGQRRF